MLQSVFYQAAARNILLNREFIRIAGLFSEKNIEVIPLKGISLIQQAYHDFTGRVFGDIDILIKPRKMKEAGAALKELGYSKRCSVKFNPAKPFSFYRNSAVFAKNEGIPCVIHLHWHLINSTIPLFMYDIDMIRVWQKAKSRLISGVEVFFLDPHHEVSYLCMHALNHGFDKPSYIEDIKRVISFYADYFDYSALEKAAKSWKVCFAVYCGLLGIRVFSKEIVPEKELSRFEPKIKTKACQRLISLISEGRCPSHEAVYRIYYEISAGLLGKAKFVFFSAFPPPGQLVRGEEEGFQASLLSLYARRIFRNLPTSSKS